MKPKRESHITLTECCGQDGKLSVQEDGLLKNVRILGTESVNGRFYSLDVQKQGIGLYEGSKVNFDHPPLNNPTAPRIVASRFGKLQNIRVESDGMRGDLRYNPHHPMAPVVKWFAENMPDVLGLSHNAVGVTSQRDGVTVVERIVAVRSVDLVADPATTKGLFEGLMDTPGIADTLGGGTGGDEGYEAKIGHLVVGIINDSSLDKSAKKKKILQALKLLDDGKSGDEPEPEPKPTEEGRRVTTPTDGQKTLQEQIDAEKAKTKKILAAVKDLPAGTVSDVFLEQLQNAADDSALKVLVEDRRKLTESAGKTTGGRPAPKSAPAGTGGQAMDVKTFAKELRKGAK